MAPEGLEGLFVLGREAVAEVHEVAATDIDLAAFLDRLRIAGICWCLKGRVMGERRVAADPVVVLDPTLGREAVVVPAHRVEDLTAPHTLVAGDRVGVRVGEHVAHVEGTADRGWRCVYGKDLVAGLRPVEPVGAVFLPGRVPAPLQTLEGGLVGDGCLSGGLVTHGGPRLAVYPGAPADRM